MIISSGKFTSDEVCERIGSERLESSERITGDDALLTLPSPAHTRRSDAWPDAVSDILNRSLGVMLLLAGLPLCIAIAMAVLVTSGRPVFHRGWRLGRDKKPFEMFKFRTLRTDAHTIIGDKLIGREDNVAIPVIGWFLRDTRLDEIPQLLNIVKGDMKFVGPRPVRPEVYEQLCRDINGYDSRFAVKPGLIGYSQVFTPHNTPKRIRTLLDSRLMSRRVRPLTDLLLIIYTMLVVGGTTLRRGVRFLKRRLLPRYREKRRLTRVQTEHVSAIVRLDGSDIRCVAPVVDIHDETFVMISGEALEPLPKRFELATWIARNGGARRISARCDGHVTQVRPTAAGFVYVIDFEPATDLGRYVVHQHFLKRSLALAS